MELGTQTWTRFTIKDFERSCFQGLQKFQQYQQKDYYFVLKTKWSLFPLIPMGQCLSQLYSRVPGPDSVIRLEILHDLRDSSGAKKAKESPVGDNFRCIGK